MAYFHGHKIEPSPDLAAQSQELQSVMSRVSSDAEPDSTLWHSLLLNAGCAELYEVGHKLAQTETAHCAKIIKCLEHFSHSQDWNIRDSVARVLATMRDRSAEPMLIRLLSDQEALVRYAALKALWNTGYQFMEPEKAAMLNDASEMVRRQAEGFFHQQEELRG